MTRDELRNTRKQTFDQMEQRLKEWCPKEEDRLFYYHSSEERIVLSHALFWVMSGSLKGKIRQEKYLQLLRQYEEEMLDAYLQDEDEFPELLRYCNIMYESLPMLLRATHDMRKDKEARKLAAMAIVAGGYGGDMPEAMANDLLDNIDYDNHGNVKCPKIVQMIPELNRMVEKEVL